MEKNERSMTSLPFNKVPFLCFMCTPVNSTGCLWMGTAAVPTDLTTTLSDEGFKICADPVEKNNKWKGCSRKCHSCVGLVHPAQLKFLSELGA